MIGFQTFRGMDGLEGDLQPRKLVLQLAHVRLEEAIPAKEQHACRFRSFLPGCDCTENLRKLLYILALGHRHDPDDRFGSGPGRDDLLLDLGGVPQNEGSGREGDLIDRTEGAAQIDGPVHACLTIEAATELPPEMAHQVDVGSGEAEDGLPVVTHGKDAHIRMLGLQRLHQPGPA